MKTSLTLLAAAQSRLWLERWSATKHAQRGFVAHPDLAVDGEYLLRVLVRAQAAVLPAGRSIGGSYSQAFTFKCVRDCSPSWRAQVATGRPLVAQLVQIVAVLGSTNYHTAVTTESA